MKHIVKTIISTLIISVLSSFVIADPSPYDAPITTPNYQNFNWINDSSNMAILRINDNGVIRDIIAYVGPIGATTTDVIRFAHEQYPYIDEVNITSPGGLTMSGIELGMFFSNNQLKVSIAPGRICLSACAYAFIGGTDYRIDGMLGFHTGYLRHNAGDPITLPLPPDNTGISPDVNNAYQQGHYMGALFSLWFLQNGFNHHLFMTISAKTSIEKFLVMKHEDELYKWMARDNDAEMNDYIKFLKPNQELIGSTTTMTVRGMMLWFQGNNGSNGHNNRGRDILSFKSVWSPQIRSKLQHDRCGPTSIHDRTC